MSVSPVTIRSATPPAPHNRVQPGLQNTEKTAKAAKAIASVPRQANTLLSVSRVMQASLSKDKTKPTDVPTRMDHLAGKLAKPVGALGILAGGAEGVMGAAELVKGDLKNGAIDASAGVATVGAGVATLARSRLAGPLAGAASIISGAGQLDGARNAEDVALGSAQVAGGGALVAAGALKILGKDFMIGGAPVGLILNALGAVLLGGTAVYQYRNALGRAAAKVWSWL